MKLKYEIEKNMEIIDNFERTKNKTIFFIILEFALLVK